MSVSFYIFRRNEKEREGTRCVSMRHSIRQPRPIDANPLGINTMKNTSLFCFSFGQCQKRKPSADPAERKLPSATDHRGVTGGAVWRPLALVIVSYR